MPTVIIPDKICPHCGGNEWTSYIDKITKSANNIRYRCAELGRERARAYGKANREKINKRNRERGYSRTYHQRHKEKNNKRIAAWRKTESGRISSRKHCKKYRQTHKEQCRIYNKAYHAKGHEELKPFYLRARIKGRHKISLKEVTILTEVLIIQKKNLCLKRKVQQLKKSAQKQE